MHPGVAPLLFCSTRPMSRPPSRKTTIVGITDEMQRHTRCRRLVFQ